MVNELPGNPQHQAALQAIVAHYQHDPRVEAVIVFGSLGRGNWDHHSDIDLNIILADGVTVDPVEEAGRLCQSLAAAGEEVVLILPTGPEEVDVLFRSLLQLSVRYHPLATTSPDIVDTMRVLAGRLDEGTIAAAGRANQRPDLPLDHLVKASVRYAVVASGALARGRRWEVIEVLHRMRGLIMTLYAGSRDGGRSLRVFAAEADAGLQARLARALPGYELALLRGALLVLVDLLLDDLEGLTAGAVALSDLQREVLQRVRSSLVATGGGGR